MRNQSKARGGGGKTVRGAEGKKKGKKGFVVCRGTNRVGRREDRKNASWVGKKKKKKKRGKKRGLWPSSFQKIGPFLDVEKTASPLIGRGKRGGSWF